MNAVRHFQEPLSQAVASFRGLPNRPEKTLINAAGQGHEAVLHSQNGQQPVIRAELLRDLCTGAKPVKDAIRLTGGWVQGRLDLSGAHLAHALRFTDCVFEDSVILRQAQAEHPVEWVGGRTATIDADEFESTADLAIQGVTVTGSISLHWANIQGDLRMSDSLLKPSNGQALNGADLRVGGTVFLDGKDFHAKGEVCLRSAQIHGQLDCRHAHFTNPSGQSINAGYLELDGDLLCDQGFHSNGDVCLERAQVHQVRATGGRFSSSTASASSTPYALQLDGLRALGVYLDRGFHATGLVSLVGADITDELNCSCGTFDNQSGRALDAMRINVDEVYLDHGFTARGEVRFSGAQIGRQFNATSGKFHNDRADGHALDADGLNCRGGVFLDRGFQATGEVSFIGAEIKGELNCTSGSFKNPGGNALSADGLNTPGSIYLNGSFRAIGEVRLARAAIGQQLMCTGGVLDNPGGTALDITGLMCNGDVLLNKDTDGSGGFRTTGKILTRGARIHRDLNFHRGELHGDEGLDARGMQVGGSLTWILDRPPKGLVDLTGAQITRLTDTKESWPKDGYMLAGFTYQFTEDSPTGDSPIKDSFTVGQRIDWLGNTKGYSLDAYQQLAQVYRLGGRESDAQTVLIAGQRDLRKRGNLSWPSKVWNWFIDKSVGYGYRLYRPFLGVLFLGLLGWLLYALAQRTNLVFSTGLPPGKSVGSAYSAKEGCPVGYPCFFPGPYSFQLLIPGLDLREASQWLPNAGNKPWGLLMMIYTWFMIIFGWVMATAVIAGVSRIFRQR